MASTSVYVQTLTRVIRDLSFTINVVTLIIGTIGSICNLITFTASQLRRNSCVFYLLCANIFQLLSILFVVPTRIALDTFGNNLENQSVIFCKIRYYLVLTLPELATYYLLLSTADRYLATSDSARVRGWSQLKVAYRLSFAVLITGFISNVHILVVYTVYNSACQINFHIVNTLGIAAHVLAVTILVPYVLMFIFCIMTYMNLRKTKRRVEALSHMHVRPAHSHRFESHIIMVIVLQVIISALLVSIRICSYLYYILLNNNPNTTLEQRVAAGFALQLGVSLYYFSFAISFYISTLTSKYFRDIFCKRITRIYRYHRDQMR